MSGQALSLKALQAALSEERLQAYATKEDSDQLDAISRYFWNVALATAIQPALHALEITVRNHLYATSLKIVKQEKLQFTQVPCWLDAMPSLLEPAEMRAVEDAKSLLHGKASLTPGRLISKLGFGFWVSLCKRPYEQGRSSGPALWPAMAKQGFPFMKREDRSRATIFHRLDRLRELRNRVSHHEPIWDRPLLNLHAEIIETLSWINQGVATAIDTLSELPDVFDAGPSAFRAQARILIRLPEQNDGQETDEVERLRWEFGLFGQAPLNWAAVGAGLYSAAKHLHQEFTAAKVLHDELMGWNPDGTLATQGRPITDEEMERLKQVQLGRVSIMLLGMSIESLAKGLLVLAEPPLVNPTKGLRSRLRTHQLDKLVGKCGYPATAEERVALQLTSEHLVWGSRYPIPVRPPTAPGAERAFLPPGIYGRPTVGVDDLWKHGIVVYDWLREKVRAEYPHVNL